MGPVTNANQTTGRNTVIKPAVMGTPNAQTMPVSMMNMDGVLIEIVRDYME